jgi:hypothetical protein
MSSISASDRTDLLSFTLVLFKLCNIYFDHFSTPDNPIFNCYSPESNLFLVLSCTRVCSFCNIEQIFSIFEMAFYHLLGGKSIIKELVSYKF